ncbi:MAG: hypothetical protein ACTSRL_03675 [Candidatus Helarchaeota archaeon]
MMQLTIGKYGIQKLKRQFRQGQFSPIMEEGLLIGIAIVAILIILGIIFGVFDWIVDAFNSLFNQF